MNIKIDLDDPTKCDDCPCFQASYFGGSPDCGKEYEIKEGDIRPQECIDKHGE